MDQVNNTRPKPVILIILDGWGVADNNPGNAIVQANTPFFNSLINDYPTTIIEASSEAVGLPWGEMGNSEVGHMTIGSGRILYQDFPRITKAIWDKTFFENQAFLKAIEHAKKNRSKLHYMGLLSSGGVHSYIEHLYALLDLAVKKKMDEIYLHIFLDGRDTPYNSGINFVKRLMERTERVGIGKIATISGRYYAMDRDNHWDRVEKSYQAITRGESDFVFTDPLQAIDSFYKKKIFDEEVFPTVITFGGKPVARVENGDSMVFFNFRSDRARQITKSFTFPSFDKFERKEYLDSLFFVSMTQYEKDLPVEVAFPPEELKNPVAKVISDFGRSQLHIAETEKYAHVTYFFNGGREEPYEKEDHILVPSPSVSSYDQKPAMSAREIREKLLNELEKDKYDFIVLNFANADMVGHTGKLKEAIEAVEVLDQCLSEICEVVAANNGAAIITADHGNAEEMISQNSGSLIKEHSINPVPLIIFGPRFKNKSFIGVNTYSGKLSELTPQGILSDIAPTILELLELEIPEEMTGSSMLKLIS